MKMFLKFVLVLVALPFVWTFGVCWMTYMLLKGVYASFTR